MSSYARINEYDFVKHYTLEQLGESLPKAQARHINGKTMVTIAGAPSDAPLTSLCDHFIELTKERKGWSQEQIQTAVTVARYFDDFNKKGNYRVVETISRCECIISERDGYCDRTPKSVKEAIELGNTLWGRQPAEQEMN